MAKDTQETYDLVVIGSGPGGYIGAIRAAQLGLKVACVERDAALGGTCLRIGCIPSKALLEASQKYQEAKHELGSLGIKVAAEAVGFDLAAMMQRKDKVVQQLTQGIAGLFKKNKVVRLHGQAQFTGRDADGSLTLQVLPVAGAPTAPQLLHAKAVLVATGSVEARLPSIELDPPYIGGSTTALAYDEVPRRLAVIGAGAIGLELGSVWSRLGAAVTVIEYAPRILWGMDSELATTTQRLLSKQGLNFILGSKVTGVRRDAKGCTVELEGKESLQADRVLVAVGRVANVEGLQLGKVGVEVDARGRIPVDAKFCSKAPGVMAIGDVIAGPMLAHKAEDEAVACVEHLATGAGHVDYDAIPYVVYTHPEVAAVGLTEDMLKEQQRAYRRGTFPFSASARARAANTTDGLVKVLADAKTDRILGVHIVGPHAGELIAEAATCMSFKASSEDLARVCHAHPTLAEAVREAALAVDGRALNM